jgi:predicted Zn-dependent protease
VWTGAFGNSAGHVATGEGFECGLSGIARLDGADGLARHAPLTLAELDGHQLGARAAAKARAWTDPVELPPGRYEVVLEPTAVADILESLAVAAFNGKAVNEQRSFVRLSEAQFDPAITIVDDPLAVGQSYDEQGTPRRMLTLVHAGTTVALTHDRRSAAEAGAESTGHAGPGTAVWGPFARHLTLAGAPGGDPAREAEGAAADSSVAALVAGVERGLLVSDLWYTRMLDPRTLAITGLTRNGLWLIEDGQVTTPLRNFRFTQSYAQALMPGNVIAIGSAVTPLPGDTYTATTPRWSCPALRLASWNFTGGASG